MLARALLMIVLAACNRADNSVVRKWLADWEVARKCMLSSPEYGRDGATASAVSSLLEARHCHEERRRLVATAELAQSKVPNWSALREELRGLTGGPDDGATIDRIDTLAAGIRATANLPAISRAREGTITPLPAGRPVKLGDREIGTSMGVKFEPGLVVIDLPDGLHAEISTLDQIRTLSIPRGHVLAYPSRTWAAQTRGDVLSIANLDGTEEARIELGDSFDAAKAMDSGTTRAVILQAMDGNGFAIAVSTNKHAWRVHRSKESLPLDNTSQDRETGIVDVVLHAGGYAYLYRVDTLEPFVFPKSVEIPRFKHHFDCRQDGVLWGQDPGDERALHRVSPASSRTFQLTKVYPNGIVDCQRTSALVLRRGQPEAVDLCRGESCRTVHTARHEQRGATALLANGSWIYAVALRGIVGVWRENVATPSFYRLAPDSAGELVAITVLGETPYLVTAVGGRYRFVQLPDKPPG